MVIKLYYSKWLPLHEIEEAIRKNFGVKAQEAGIKKLPSHAYNEARKQYNAFLLATSLPPFSLWIVHEDIYFEGMNFVFGLTVGRKAVVSTYRLPSMQMVVKEAIHELGHVFGLAHCRNYCVMQFSNSLMEAMKKPNELCSDCRKKLIKWKRGEED